jgi:phosphoglycolate phosphatase
LKAILFDFDGTLIDSKINFTKMKKKIIELFKAAGVNHEILDEKMSTHEIEEVALKYLKTNKVKEALIKKIFHDVTKTMNKIELEAVDSVKLMDGVFFTLEKLKHFGLKIGIITRSCREYVYKVLRKFKLEKLIDAVAARDDVLRPKPSPEHPQYLMKKLEVNPSDTILVGDQKLDAICAKKAGINFFLFLNKEKKIKKYDDEVVVKLPHLIEIFKSKYFKG